jgi:hypothetical protein
MIFFFLSNINNNKPCYYLFIYLFIFSVDNTSTGWADRPLRYQPSPIQEMVPFLNRNAQMLSILFAIASPHTFQSAIGPSCHQLRLRISPIIIIIIIID